MDAEENSADYETFVDAMEKSAVRLVDAEENSADCETVVDKEVNSAAVRLLWMQRRKVL